MMKITVNKSSWEERAEGVATGFLRVYGSPGWSRATRDAIDRDAEGTPVGTLLKSS